MNRKHFSIVSRTRWTIAAGVMGLLFTMSGCLGIFGGQRQAARPLPDYVSGPDKCSRCHDAWSKRFDYYRGWDRYGCIFDGRC